MVPSAYYSKRCFCEVGLEKFGALRFALSCYLKREIRIWHLEAFTYLLMTTVNYNEIFGLVNGGGEILPRHMVLHTTGLLRYQGLQKV